MKFKTLFVVDAVVLLLFGLGFLFMPVQLIAFYGAALQPPGAAMGRFFGATALAIAWMMFKAKDDKPSMAIDGLMQGNILAWVLTAAIALLGQIQGTFNLLGWSTIGMGVFFTAWFVYVKYIQKD